MMESESVAVVSVRLAVSAAIIRWPAAIAAVTGEVASVVLAVLASASVANLTNPLTTVVAWATAVRVRVRMVARHERLPGS